MDSSPGSGYRQRDRTTGEHFSRHRLFYERRIAIFAVLAAASVSFAFKQRLFAPNEVERKSVHCAQVEVRAR